MVLLLLFSNFYSIFIKSKSTLFSKEALHKYVQILYMRRISKDTSLQDKCSAEHFSVGYQQVSGLIRLANTTSSNSLLQVSIVYQGLKAQSTKKLKKSNLIQCILNKCNYIARFLHRPLQILPNKDPQNISIQNSGLH